MLYKRPKCLDFDENKSFYIKPPERFIGYFQYRNAKKNYFDEEKVKKMKKRAETQKKRLMRRQHAKSDRGRKAALSVNEKNKKKKMMKTYSGFFSRKHAVKVGSVPSFLTTFSKKKNNYSKYVDLVKEPSKKLQYQKSKLWLSKHRMPDLKPQKVDQIHMKRYNDLNKETRFHEYKSAISDQDVFNTLKEPRGDEIDLLNSSINIYSSVNSYVDNTLKFSSTTGTDFKNFSLSKKKENVSGRGHIKFLKDFKAQNLKGDIEKFKIFRRDSSKRQLLKGTIGVNIPSSSQIYMRDRKRMQSLYPQNYLED